MKRQTHTIRSAFTLVEILIVVAIIGILMGLALTGVNAARKAIQRRAIAMEVEVLSQAIEAYKQKYDAYPPDGSSLAAFRAHFQQVFPSMQTTTEIAALQTVATTPNAAGIMDSAEALVFCLGGFSNDPNHPFTGKGGPLVQNGGVWYYNIDRNEGFHRFAQETLTINSSGISTDESSSPDKMPVYLPKGRAAPIVYFNSSSYVGNSYGAAKPLKAEAVNNNIAWATNKDKHYRFMNEKSFQLISAGLDDDFGPVLSATQYFTFPSGKLIDVNDNNALNNALSSGYSVQNGPSAALDNVTNFSEGALQDSLP